MTKCSEVYLTENGKQAVKNVLAQQGIEQRDIAKYLSDGLGKKVSAQSVSQYLAGLVSLSKPCANLMYIALGSPSTLDFLQKYASDGTISRKYITTRKPTTRSELILSSLHQLEAKVDALFELHNRLPQNNGTIHSDRSNGPDEFMNSPF